MTMYSAYFDESGHPDDSKYLVVAGAVADVDQWVHFEREWQGMLAPLGTDVVFHAVDFEQGNPPFDRLSASEADQLIERLAGIICRRVEKTISQAILIDQHVATNRRYVFSETYGFPYPMCARSCIGEVEKWADKHSVVPSEIRYFFEDGAKHRGQIEWMSERDDFPLPRFPKKKDVVPLQCGDFLAWSHHCFLTTGKVSERYARALTMLYDKSAEWEVIDLSDPHRLPAIQGIPVRNHLYHYRQKIMNKNGKRIAAVHYWPKAIGAEPKVKRKTLVLPEPNRRSAADVIKAAKEYDARKHGLG